MSSYPPNNQPPDGQQQPYSSGQQQLFPPRVQQPYPQNIQHPDGQQPSYSPGTQQLFSPGTQQPYPQSTQVPDRQPTFPPSMSQPHPPHIQQPYPQNTQPPVGQQQLYPRRYQHYFDEKQMRRYFYSPSRIWIWLFGLGIVFFLFGIIISSSVGVALGGTPFFTVGLFPLAIGGIALLIHYTQRPSSEQYEKWVAERSEALYSKALQRLHLDEKDDCECIIEVQGGISSLLQLTKKFPEKEIVVKRLPDGFRHYSINSSIYIFLTRNDIAIYSGYINALAQHERFEDADHYYYRDIVAVSTTGPMFVFEDGLSEREVQKQGFLVRASNGDAVGTDYAVKVALRDGNNREQLKGVDEVVAALLHLLRDHKDSVAH